MPKRFIALKWAVYTAAAALLLLFQLFVCGRIRIWGMTPFLLPILVGVTASFEGSSAAPFFAFGLGLVCDLGGLSPGPGFFTFLLPLAALITALLTENLFSPGLLSSFVAAALCLLIVAVGRIVGLLAGGQTEFLAMCSVALREFIVSLPLLAVVFPLLRLVHRKTTFDY